MARVPAGHRALLEETYASLRRKTELGRRQRSKPLSSRYLTTNDQGDLVFVTTSGTYAHKRWQQRIRFKGLAAMRGRPITQRQFLAALQAGELAVFCSCPDFKFKGYKYMSWKGGWGIVPETRFPKIRNPHLEGSVCKHLYNVLGTLPFHVPAIVKDLRREGDLEAPAKPSGKSGGKGGTP